MKKIENKFFKNICMSMAFILILGTFPMVVAAESIGAESNMTEAVVAENQLERIATEALPFFESRLTEPSRENAYFYADNAYYQGGYGMPNCTAYAWGRAYEILGAVPNLPMGNANDWWGRNNEVHRYPTGATPKLGAIICWAAGSSGHVAVVEKIQGDQVTYSESAWSGPIFTSDTYTIGTENSVSVGGFQGYIYIGDFIDAASDKMPPVLSNLEISEVDEDGFTISAEVKDEGTGIDKVLFPVWTDKGGQDDLIWYVGKLDQNKATYRVSYQDHEDEKGDYIVHVYAYDKAGLSARESIQKTAIIDYRSSHIALRMIADNNPLRAGI